MTYLYDSTGRFREWYIGKKHSSAVFFFGFYLKVTAGGRASEGLLSQFFTFISFIIMKLTIMIEAAVRRGS